MVALLNTPRQRRALVVGLGTTGLSCVRHLHARDVRVTVVDSRAEPPELERCLVEFPDVPVSLGKFDQHLTDDVDELVLSPGVSIREPIVQRALARQLSVVGDIELFARVNTASVIAVTGSNGKSTVTSMLGEMATACGVRCAAGGNLGPTALSLLERRDVALIVLELSSFQLETTESLVPVAATVLNLSADHLDRYAGFAEYGQAKQRIFAAGGHMVINADDRQVARMRLAGRPFTEFTLGVPTGAQFGIRHHAGKDWLSLGHSRLLGVDRLPVPGTHNQANALAALALGRAAGLELEPMLAALQIFRGLAHRCELVAERDGVKWINDSKATNVGATVAALRGLGAQGPVILIAGGDGKGADFTPLIDPARRFVRQVILIGRDGPLLRSALQDAVATRSAEDLDDAVRQAHRLASAGNTVLLAPACASFDMFANFEARGEAFRRAVASVLNQ